MPTRSKFKGFNGGGGWRKKKLVEIYSSLELDALCFVFFSLQGKRANVFCGASVFAALQTRTAFVTLKMKASLWRAVIQTFTEKSWRGKRSKTTSTVQITTVLMTEAEIGSASVGADGGREFLPLQRPREASPWLKHVLMYLCFKRVLLLKEVLSRPSSGFVVFCFSALEHFAIQNTAPKLPATPACDGHGGHSHRSLPGLNTKML